MKKYYLHNGTDQQGPFDTEDLKAKLIKKDTPIWYEGLSDWTTADKIDELKDLFKTTTPPPFSKKQTPPPPINKQIAQSETKQTEEPTVKPKKKSNVGRTIAIIVIVLIAIVGGLKIFDKMSRGSGYGSGGDTYKEKVMTVKEIERLQPTKFLMADGKYENNFWGDKILVHGVITNNATVATYKDAVVRVTYYSKTKTVLGNKDYTVYEMFPPHSTTEFELKIDNYKDVNTIGWDVIKATAN
jgi:hypothetical protein